MTEFVYTNAQQRRPWRVVRDLIAARELLFDLIWKDLRVRYRYAVMGFLWAVLEPLAMMLVLTFVIVYVFDIRFDGAGGGYSGAASILCGLVFWQFTATSLSAGTQSMLTNQNLVNKVYFTREVIPIATLGYPFVNLVVGFAVLLVVHLALGGALGLALVAIPFVFAIQFVMTLGLALLLSCTNVLYRDVGYIAGVAIMFGFYASPVFYPVELVTETASIPGWAAKLYLVNPMAELLTAYRQILFEQRLPEMLPLVWPAVLSVAALLLGTVLFRRISPTLSDYL